MGGELGAAARGGERLRSKDTGLVPGGAGSGMTGYYA